MSKTEIPVTEARQRNVNFKVTNPETTKVKAKFSSGREKCKEVHSRPLYRIMERFPSFGVGVGDDQDVSEGSFHACWAPEWEGALFWRRGNLIKGSPGLGEGGQRVGFCSMWPSGKEKRGHGPWTPEQALKSAGFSFSW